MNKIKILFLIQTLGGGGAERVLVNLVNNMDSSKFDITVLTMFEGGVNRELLSDHIRYKCRNLKMFSGVSKVITALPSSLSYKYFVGKEKYDIAVAYMHSLPVVVLAGCKEEKTKKIAWLHCGDMKAIPSRYIETETAKKRWDSFDRIACVSDYSAKAFSEAVGLKEKLVTVYNTNDCARIKEQAAEEATVPSGAPVIVSVGRFTHEKGYLRLLSISKRLKDDGFDHVIMLIGDGAEREMLKSEAEKLGISDSVVFTGFQKNPYKYLAKSDIFVCSSFTEGLSTATTEALLLELPIVSTDVSGAKEILGENNEWGIVTDLDDDSLYEGIKRMLCDKELRNKYRNATKERAPFFDTASTAAQAEKLFFEVLDK